MKRFLIFVCILFVFGVARADDIECKTGEFFNGTECEWCPVGSTTYTTDATECEPCPAGTYGKSKEGFKAVRVCVPCAAGTYSDAGATECTVCPAGTYSMDGATECDTLDNLLVPGTYYDETSDMVKYCPAEYPNSEPGATEKRQCYSDTMFREWTGKQITPDVPAGCTDAIFDECKIDACEYTRYYLMFGGLGFRSGCETNNENCTQPILSVTANPGYIVNGTMCEQCPAGTYSAGGDSAECIQCPIGTYSTAGASECTICPIGTYSDVAGATECTLCPLGSSTENTGATDSGA